MPDEHSWALHGIDHRLYNDYFKGRKDLHFIECGANDGHMQSNTMYFDYYHGWRGMLIEAIPDRADMCRKFRGKKNIVENYALVGPEHQGKDTIDILHFPECYGLMSAIAGTPGIEQQQIKAMEQGVIIKVPAITLTALLEKNRDKIPSYDLLVLDVEGYEMEVLRGLDLHAWPIPYLLIEERDHDNSEVYEYLKEHYHRRERYGDHDVLYIRKSEWDRITVAA